jgi:TolB protein
MGRRAIPLLALLALIVSCTSPESDVTTTLASEPETTTTTSTEPRVDPGRLAVVDDRGEVVVMRPDGSDRVALTDRGDNPGIHMQPVWSPDGSILAWGQSSGTGFGIGIGRPASGEVKILTTPNLPFYTYWSPNSRYLGALHNGTTGVQFQIVDVEEETTQLLDEAAPFYFSWSPEGDRVVTHAGVSRTQIITPQGDRVDLEPTSGHYMAPEWTPRGVFLVVDRVLMLEDGEGRRTPVADISGPAMFVANPQGTHVALQTIGDASTITASTEEIPSVVTDSVVVVDVATGGVEMANSSPAVGFFWSPDGRSLLILAADESGITPRVWQLDGTASTFATYRPAPRMLSDTFPFFPQYAQSVSFWSPDSTSFAFAGAVDGDDGIWIQDLDSDTPRKVSDGSWVAWSPSGD